MLAKATAVCGHWYKETDGFLRRLQKAIAQTNHRLTIGLISDFINLGESQKKPTRKKKKKRMLYAMAFL